MHGVYVLESKKDKSLYIGYSNDIKRRLREHNEGKSLATRKKHPFKLIYCELFAIRADALEREKYLKSGWGRNYLKRTLKNTLG